MSAVRCAAASPKRPCSGRAPAAGPGSTPGTCRSARADSVIGAARIEPAPADDDVGREHAQALAALLAQGLWRLRLPPPTSRRARQAAAPAACRATFLAAVSHDLRTPLAAIVAAARRCRSSASRLAAERAGPDAGEHRRPRRATSPPSPRTPCSWCACRRRAQALRASGSRSRRSSAASSAGCAARAVRRARPSRASRARLPLVRGDATLLAQLLDQPARQRAASTATGAVELQRRAPRRAASLLSVKDRGPGIAPDDESRLFEPFFRGEAETDARGAGLGLALCKAIAEAHGGTLACARRAQRRQPLHARPAGPGTADCRGASA